MYRKLSCKITEWFVDKKIISSDEREIYQYSVEVLLSDAIYLFVAFLTALLTNSLLASIAFLLGFLLLRKFSGGYHASTYLRCHFLFWVNQILMIAVYYLLPGEYSRIASLIFISISIVCVFVLAPVENENKPLSDKEKRKYGFLSKMVIIFDAAVVLVLSITEVYFQYICMYTFGVFSVSISLLAEKIKYLKRGEITYENNSENDDTSRETFC